MSHRLAVAGVLVLGVASCAGHSSEGGLSGDSTPPLTHLVLPPLDTAPAPTTLPEPVPTTTSPSGVGSAPAQQVQARSNFQDSGIWQCIAMAESNDDPAADSGNGYFGAFQFAPATWDYAVTLIGLPQYATGRADEAPFEVQLAAAQALEAQDGWTPWPDTAPECGA